MMRQEVYDFLAIAKDEVIKVSQSLNEDAMMEAANLIEHCELHHGRVHVTGIGKPGHVAGYMASLLSSTGTSAYELHGTEAVHGSAGQVKAGDVVIALSNSGETQELKATVEALRRNGALIIACTGNEASWLAQHASVCLKAHVDQEGDTLNKPPRASILAEILVLQILSVELQARKQLNTQEYLKWHPGGSLGASIRNEDKE